MFNSYNATYKPIQTPGGFESCVGGLGCLSKGEYEDRLNRKKSTEPIFSHGHWPLVSFNCQNVVGFGVQYFR